MTILTLNDDLQLKDILNEERKLDSLRGQKSNFIVLKDPETGTILGYRKNLVVRTGREYNLRKIFGMPYNGETITQLNNRTINLFSIGKGGSAASDPFSPLPVTATDQNMNTEVAFRAISTSQNLGADAPKYTDMRTLNGVNYYYKKTFTSKSIVLDDTNNDYYVKVGLDITDLDARGEVISELGLYTSEVNSGVYSNFRMATRVTFPSESMTINTKKGLAIDYYIYS